MHGFQMTTLSALSLSISTNSSQNSPFCKTRCCLLPKLPLPITSFHLGYTKFGAVHQNLSKMKLWAYRDEGFLIGLRMSKKDGSFWGDGKLRREKRVLTVRFNNFDFNGGNGRKVDANTTRVLTNLGLAVGLTYLTVTGQLGWILDTIVSLWLFAIILLAVVFGAILWWAGRGMIESTGCPNCGNNFPFVKSLADESQACPFCGYSFSVEEFMSEPINFSSKRSTASGQTFDDFSPRSRKGKKNTLKDIIDIEAEVKDLD